MSQEITDQNPVSLNAAYDVAGATHLLYASTALPSSEPHLLIHLVEDHQTQISISDFVVDSTTQEVYAHRVNTGGSLSAWTRVSGGVGSPTCTFSSAPLTDEVDEFDVMVRAAPAGGGAPTYTTQQAAESAGASRVRVKIIKHGSRPDRIVQRR